MADSTAAGGRTTIVSAEVTDGINIVDVRLEATSATTGASATRDLTPATDAVMEVAAVVAAVVSILTAVGIISGLDAGTASPVGVSRRAKGC